MPDKILQSDAKDNFKRKYFALPDLLLLGIILCVAILGAIKLFVGSDQGELYAVVSVGGQDVQVIRLAEVQEEYTLAVKGYNGEESKLLVTCDSVEFLQSPCPDHLCVNTGKLTKAGDSAVCLPLRISIGLVSERADWDVSHPDAIVG